MSLWLDGCPGLGIQQRPHLPDSPTNGSGRPGVVSLTTRPAPTHITCHSVTDCSEPSFPIQELMTSRNKSFGGHVPTKMFIFFLSEEWKTRNSCTLKEERLCSVNGKHAKQTVVSKDARLRKRGRRCERGCWERAERLLFGSLLYADPRQCLQDRFRSPICRMRTETRRGLRARLECGALPSQHPWLSQPKVLDKDQHPFMGKGAQLRAQWPLPVLPGSCCSEEHTSGARKDFSGSPRS